MQNFKAPEHDSIGSSGIVSCIPLGKASLSQDILAEIVPEI